MSRSRRRYIRTMVLGLLAMAVLIWTAVDQFGIPWGEIRQLFLGIVVGVLLVIGAAALVAALWMGVRRLIRRDN